jgi:hypothetical protein
VTPTHHQDIVSKSKRIEPIAKISIFLGNYFMQPKYFLFKNFVMLLLPYATIEKKSGGQDGNYACEG